MPQEVQFNLREYPTCTILGAIVGSLGTWLIVVFSYIVIKLFQDKRKQHRHYRRETQRVVRVSSPIENSLSGATVLNEDIYAGVQVAPASHQQKQDIPQLEHVDEPPPSDFLPDPPSSCSSSRSVVESGSFFEDDPQAPGEAWGTPSQMMALQNNAMPPSISRYDSLVAWFKSMSGV